MRVYMRIAMIIVLRVVNFATSKNLVAKSTPGPLLMGRLKSD
jgi:hypothetical protein